MSARVMVAGLLMAVGFGTAWADGQHLSIEPRSLQPTERQFELDLSLSTDAALLGALPGIAFRLCWDQPEAELVGATAQAPAPIDGDRALGTLASLQSCSQSRFAHGIPMLWIDLGATWPDSGDVLLATVALQVPDDYEGIIRFWIEAAATGPGVNLTSEPAEVRYLGDEIFRDRFQFTQL